jgi:hypothetical protein
MSPSIDFIGWLCATLTMFVAAKFVDVPSPDNVKQGKKDPVQTLKFSPLPGKAVGVFVTDIKDAMAAEGRSGPPGAVGFAFGRSPYRWVYLPCEGKSEDASTITLPVGSIPGEERQFKDVCVATQASLKSLGFTAPYSLVEVEVNDGLGSPANADKFKASQPRLLEGTDAYHLRVSDVVRDLKERYKAYLEGQRQEIDKAINHLAIDELKKQAPTGPRETSDQIYVTWVMERDFLRVEFRTRVVDGFFKYGKGIEQGPTQLQFRRSPTQKRGSRYGTIIEAELGMIYEVSRAGDLERSEPVPLGISHQELPPPQRMAR